MITQWKPLVLSHHDPSVTSNHFIIFVNQSCVYDLFFGDATQRIFALQTQNAIDAETIIKTQLAIWRPALLNTTKIDGVFVGPRVSMVTPWSTNAVEITQNMGIKGMIRIEQFTPLQAGETIDPMVSERFENLNQNLFTVEISPEPIREIDDISAYNLAEGLSLNPDEVRYLEQLAEQLGRPLTDSEVFGFSKSIQNIVGTKFLMEHSTLTVSNKRLVIFPNQKTSKNILKT